MKVARAQQLLADVHEAEVAYLRALEVCRAEGAALVRAWRRERGWTQLQLGQVLGVNDSYISKVETGMMPLSRQLARRLYQAEIEGL